jgi:CNT family concentrative nucleoside transporter
MVMTLGMSTVSGVVLILYASTLAAVLDNALGHLVAASIVSLPAALMLARIMVPEDGKPGTAADADAGDLKFEGSIDAIVRGTLDGLQLFLAIIAILLVVFALVALSDQVLAQLPAIGGAPLTLQRVFGAVFAPLLWLIGVPWPEAPAAGALMGTKVILNEYVAYQQLAALDPGVLSGRSRLITVYALCGFANLASIGLLLSTLGTLAPSRRAEAASLGIKCWIAGNLATAMTGAVIGIVGM